MEDAVNFTNKNNAYMEDKKTKLDISFMMIPPPLPLIPQR